MKKKLTLVLALCACFAFSAAFAACETEEPTSSSSPAVSSPADSTPETPAPTVNPLTEAQWKALFAFNNVTVSMYEEVEGTKVLGMAFGFDGENVRMAMPSEGMDMTFAGQAATYRTMFDLSGYYAQVSYKDGKYLVPSHTVNMYGEAVVYENIYVTVVDNKITSMVATVGGEEGTIEFTDYGTTVVTLNTMPISREDWASAFDASKFTNITTTASFTLAGIGDVVETISYANGTEKVEVTFENPAMNGFIDLYNVDNEWYAYYIQEDSAIPVTLMSEEDIQTYLGCTQISMMIKNFIAMGASMYDYVAYDEVTGEVYVSDEGTEMRFTIADGELLGYTIIMEMENEFEETYESVYTFTFSKQGETSFEVPFEVSEKVE